MTDRRLLNPLQKMLLDGADYLETWGHCKGSYFDYCKGSYFDSEHSKLYPPACLVGSLQAVRNIEKGLETYVEIRLDRLVRRGEKYMDQYLRVDDCTQWNDAPERKPKEVIQALRDAAAVYKEDSDEKEMADDEA